MTGAITDYSPLTHTSQQPKKVQTTKSGPSLHVEAKKLLVKNRPISGFISKKAMQVRGQCPLCKDTLLRHFNGGQLSWFCSTCYQPMPGPDAYFQ